MAQQTITEEGAFTQTIRDQVNENFDELYAHLAAETLTAAYTLTAAESGKTIFLSSATEFAVTLPEPAAGLEFDFYVTAAPASASYTIVTNDSANIIVGHIVSSEDAAGSGDFEASGGDTITFVDAKAVKGDRCTLKCDGTNWYATAFASVQDGITITTAS